MPKTDKPNILVIWGDDIGILNLSCYSHGLMGYKTPNIDRIAKEGMMFTDSYGEQSCTAGRSSFITGQSILRTGLSKVGIPGAPGGMQENLVTVAAALKNHGYATGQFGKNHAPSGSDPNASRFVSVATDSLVNEIEEAASWAREKRDSRAYVDAVKHKAILSGKWIEKTAVGTPSEYADIDAMSRAELIEFILASLESGELALDHKPESDQGNECV